MHKESAYTIIETLVVLSLLAILLVIGLPTWQNIFSQTQTNKVIDKLITSLHFARAESVKRNAIVKVCRTQDKKTCDENWLGDWAVFALHLNQAELIQTFKLDPKIGSITANREYIRFDPSGMSRSTATTITYKPAGNNPQERYIVINWVGRISLKR